MAKKKIELITLSIINFVNLRLEPLTYTISTILWILITDFYENSMRFSVNKIHQIIPMLQWNHIKLLEKLFDIEQYILRCKVFGFLFIKSLHFHMIDGDRACNLNNVNEPIPQFIFKGVKCRFKAISLEKGKIITFKGYSDPLVKRIQL
jgi:hypothetical protein